MKVTFLGTGTSQGVPVIACSCEVCLSQDRRDKRLRVSVWVEIGGLSLVIDAGPDFREQMLAAQVQDIDAILLTHEHRDHIAGLDDVRPFNFKYRKDMPLYGLSRTLEQVKLSLPYAFEEGYPGKPHFLLQEVTHEQPFTIGGQTVIPIEVYHAELRILGFRIADFAYITDASYIAEAEKQKLKDLEVLVLNAPQYAPHYSHYNVPEALDIIEELQPKRAYLTHLSHHIGKQADVESRLPSGVALAFDGLVLSFRS